MSFGERARATHWCVFAGEGCQGLTPLWGGISSAGFYAENLLLYSQQAQAEGLLPLPIGETHKFAPVALGVSDSGNHPITTEVPTACEEVT